MHRKRGDSNKRVSNKKLRALGWIPRYPTFAEAMHESVLPSGETVDEDADSRNYRPGMEAAKFLFEMRQIRLTGREANVVRAIGFAEPMLGAEIQDFTRMEGEDVTDTLNSLMAAGFVESIPYTRRLSSPRCRSPSSK